MKRTLPALLLLVCGCGRHPDAPEDTPGARLERAAIAQGLVVDPRTVDPVGSWARDTDRVCVAPRGEGEGGGGGGGDLAVGALSDYGEGQGCVASGRGRRHGARLSIRFGACRFDATVEGDRLAFPASLPAACDHLCTGRASLAALAVDRLSNARSEAATLRAPSGKPLCSG